MEIPLLDLKKQYLSIKNELDVAVKKVIESQYFILSPEVENLEKELALYCGVSHAAGVASGTDALILALRALGVGKGDVVITTPFTFFATSEAISILGAKPLFVDIEQATYNIDPDKLEEVIKRSDPSKRNAYKAIIPVHLYGQCANMERIMGIAKRYNLRVVEDCAQAIGAEYNGKKAGSFGETGCFSFFPSKNLNAFGDGGMVVSNGIDIVKRIKKLRVHGSQELYIHEEIGYNSRLDSLQAAIVRVKLKHLDGWLERRREIASKYNKAFSKIGIKIPEVGKGNKHTYHQYTIAIDERDEFVEYMADKKISVRVYYPVPLHLQPCYKDLNYSIGSFPVAEHASEKVVSLPVYPELTDEQVAYIIDSVKDFLK
ncbi:MAG: DegT/DnrJ/EryC1/StrS family aminotransferase [Candidatus Omnitrophica bacterium]|nr:DegT/DnrJ/EryC1/StrS family aminotransferase [Candidatus Omnitrophota bacterium]